MSKFVIIPCPHEATTTYGKGTKNGPAAILKAMEQVEEFDFELNREIERFEIQKPCSIKELKARAAKVLGQNKIPIILGGEHSLSSFAVQAFNNVSVLQFDAHADLRDSYKGSKNNHACAMRRILEICPGVQVGIRNISKEEYEFAKKSGQLGKIHFLNPKSKIPNLNKVLEQLSDNVYITFDVDAFDPSVVSATGTPEPGGLGWYQTLDILKAVCRAKNIVGFDVVELSPKRDDIASDFAAAKLIYKIASFLQTA